VRPNAGRLAGQNDGSDSQRGFVLTLARASSTSAAKGHFEICTNQALCAARGHGDLTAARQGGLREMASRTYAKAQFALSELLKIPGVRRTFDAPSSTNSRSSCRAPVKLVMPSSCAKKSRAAGVGYRVSGTDKRALVCVTETTTRAEIERFAGALEARARAAHFKGTHPSQERSLLRPASRKLRMKTNQEGFKTQNQNEGLIFENRHRESARRLAAT